MRTSRTLASVGESLGGAPRPAAARPSAACPAPGPHRPFRNVLKYLGFESAKCIKSFLSDLLPAGYLNVLKSLYIRRAKSQRFRDIAAWCTAGVVCARGPLGSRLRVRVICPLRAGHLGVACACGHPSVACACRSSERRPPPAHCFSATRRPPARCVGIARPLRARRLSALAFLAEAPVGLRPLDSPAILWPMFATFPHIA